MADTDWQRSIERELGGINSWREGVDRRLDHHSEHLGEIASNMADMVKHCPVVVGVGNPNFKDARYRNVIWVPKSVKGKTLAGGGVAGLIAAIVVIVELVQRVIDL